MNSYSGIPPKTTVIWALISDGARAFVFRYHENEVFGSLRMAQEKIASYRDNANQSAPLLQTQNDKISQNLNLHDTNDNVCELFKTPNKRTTSLVRKFEQNIATRLQQAYNENAFDYLVIVAPKQSLNLLQDSLSNSLQQCLLENMPMGYICDKKKIQLAFRREEAQENRSHMQQV